MEDTYNEGHSAVQILAQDPTNLPFIAYMNKVEQETTLTVETAIDDMTITVASATGFSAGKYVGIFSFTTGRFYQGRVLSVSDLVITMDTPLDSIFPVDSVVGVGIDDMSVDGSTTTQIFSVRGADPGINVYLDITRLIFECFTETAVTLAKFGDITALTKGIVLRINNGVTYNVFNVKSNGGLAGIMFDLNPYTSFGLGQNGFIARLTFSGQSEMGSVIRIGPGEELQLLIQDDLSDLQRFRIAVEGHIVD